MRRICLFLALLIAAPALHATVIVPAEFREIVAESEIIVHARVVDVRPEWEDGQRRVRTIVTVETGTFLKGEPAQTLTFTVPGGQIGRYRSVMVGAPQFEPGDEAVLFLQAGTSGVRVFGFNQGVFRVEYDRRSGRRMVVPPALLARSTTPEVLVRGSSVRRSQPLETFAAQVNAVIAETRSAR